MRIVLFRRKISKLLQIISLLGAGIMFFFLYKTPLLNNQAINIATNEEEIGKKGVSGEITATKVSFEGVSKDLIPYVITAEKAVKISPDLYRLEEINAHYSPEYKSLIIKGDQGIINNLNHQINLKGQIQAFTQELTVSSQQMQIDLLTEEIFGNGKVRLDYKNSVINAHKFNLKDKNIIILEGNVRTKFYLQGF